MRYTEHMQKGTLSSITVVGALFLMMFGVSLPNINSETANAYVTTDPLSPLNIQARPPFPKPGDTVQLSLQAGTINLSHALITWRVNGQVVMQNHGARQYILEIGPAGSVYDITVTARSPEGTTVSGSHRITVSDIAVVWEGNTYTPLLYKGRPLYSTNSMVRAMAIPTVLDTNGREYSPDELTYRWHVGGSRVPTHEGRGKYWVDITGSRPLQSAQAIVYVFDPSGNERIRQSFSVPIQSPRLVYYVSDSVFGLILERALVGSYSMPGREEVIAAEPYYMEAYTRNDQTLQYEWKVGGRDVPAMGSILLSSEGTSAGTSRISTRVISTSHFLQSAQNELSIRFNEVDVNTPITTPL